MDLLTRGKIQGRKKDLRTRIVKIESREKTLAILLRFNAIADKRQSSVTAEIPLFHSLERQCSLFITEKLPSAHIFRFLIIKKYSDVPT